MNQQQQTFHDFIMQRVQPGNEAQVEALLAQDFAKQDAGTFAREDGEATFTQLKTLLKPEAVGDLGQAFAQMRGQMHPGGGPGGPGGPDDGHPHMHGDWHGDGQGHGDGEGRMHMMDGKGQGPADGAAPATPTPMTP